MISKSILAVFLALAIVLGGITPTAPTSAFGQEGHGIACSYCGHPANSPWHYSSCPLYSGGSSGDGYDSGLTNEEKIERTKNMSYFARAVFTPVWLASLVVIIPMGFIASFNQPDYFPYVFTQTYYITEPYWILPYYAAHVPYYFVVGTWSYFTMNLFNPDPDAYAQKVGKASLEAQERQRSAQADFVRWEQESAESRERRIQDRIAEARRQAAEEAKHSQLRRIYGGIEEWQKKLDAPETRVRMFAARLDHVDEDAVRTVRSSDYRGSTREDLLFGAFNVGTSAFGLPGELLKSGIHAVDGAVDTARDLLYFENNRMENRAAAVESINRILKSLEDLPPEERKKEYEKCWSLVASQHGRIAADSRTAWSHVRKSIASRKNWKEEAPLLRKNLQKYGAGMIVDRAIGMGIEEVPILKNWPNLESAVSKGAESTQFFRALGKETAGETGSAIAGKGLSSGIDWIDDLVERGRGDKK